MPRENRWSKSFLGKREERWVLPVHRKKTTGMQPKKVSESIADGRCANAKPPLFLSFTADIADKRFDLLPPEGPVVISFSFRVGHRDAEHPAFLVKPAAAGKDPVGGAAGKKKLRKLHTVLGVFFQKGEKVVRRALKVLLGAEDAFIEGLLHMAEKKIWLLFFV